MAYKSKNLKRSRNKALAAQRTVKDSYNQALGLQDTLKNQYKDLAKVEQSQKELTEMGMMLPIYAEMFNNEDSDVDSDVLDVNLMNLYFKGLM